jgi:RimJ/RimL family protein N-acetyltransferase
MENQLEVVHIPQASRQSSQELIHSIAEAVFGTREEALFAEAFVPSGGRVPEPKVRNFAMFLMRGPRLLWAIKFNSAVVGFILVSDMPFPNALGMRINSKYAGKGIMTKALKEVLTSKQLHFPLHGYTSIRNVPAQRLLEIVGFQKDSTPVSFLGESSIHFFTNTK